MADTSNIPDNATLAGLIAAAGAIGAAAKPAFDWLTGRRKDRVSAEDLVRDDLMIQLKDQRIEITMLRAELSDARREVRELSSLHQATIKQWQEKYGEMLVEIAMLRATVTLQVHDVIANQVSQQTLPKS